MSLRPKVRIRVPFAALSTSLFGLIVAISCDVAGKTLTAAPVSIRKDLRLRVSWKAKRESFVGLPEDAAATVLRRVSFPVFQRLWSGIHRAGLQFVAASPCFR